MLRNNKYKRFIASLLVTVMLFVSFPLNLVAVAEDTSGIGVINNAYADTTDRNYYQVKFYKIENDVRTEVTSPGFNVNGKTIDNQGYFDLQKGSSIDLLSYETIKNFIKSNNITQVEITFCEDHNSNTKKYKFYSAAAPQNSGAEADNDTKSVTYTITTKRQKYENGSPVFENIVDPNTGEITGTRPVYENVELTSADYKLCTFTSTEIFEHDVNVTWRDTGTTNRPTLSFDISRTYEGATNSEALTLVTPNPTEDTSNLSVYKYDVPKYNEEGKPYTYTAGLSNSVDLSGNGVNGKEYRYEHTENTSEFTLYGKKSFDFDIKWLSGNLNLLPQDEPELGNYIKNYIKTNYDIYDGTDSANPAKVWNTIDESKITYTIDNNGVVSVKISGLDEITSDGRAKVYYLQKKTEGNTVPITGNTDKWKVTVENSGVNSADIEKVYQGATISNVITGTRDFDVMVNWVDSGDEPKQQTRESTQNAANVILWRYADGKYSTPAEDQLRTAHVSNQQINGGDNHSTAANAVTFTGLEKYDRYGYEYVYYATENIALSGYDVVYETAEDHANSGETITNKLAGVRKFKVEADWKAAARQGGTANVTYQVQKQVNGVWVPVEVPDLDENGNMLDSSGNIVTDEAQASKEGKLIIKNFQAETMSKSAQFADLPEYDNSGNRIEYRVVQVDLHRTDKTVQSSDSTLFPDNDDEKTNGKIINLNERTETVGQTSQQKHDEYKLTVVEDADTYKFTYQLVGNIPLNIVKKWNDSAYYADTNNTQPLSHSSHTVYAEVDRMDFGSTEFVPYSYTTNTNVDPTTVPAQDYCVQIASNDSSVTVTGEYVNEQTQEHDKNITNSTDYIMKWTKTISVPIYDEDGHEYQYQVEERTDIPGGFDASHYTVWITYDKLTNTYTIENTYTPPGGPSLDFSKEWQDDGDTLHRNSVTVHYSDKVYRNDNGQPYNPNNVTGTAGYTSIEEANSWKARIPVISSYVYDSNDFEEKETAQNNYYVKLNRIYCDMSFSGTATISGLEAGTYKVMNSAESLTLLNETEINTTTTLTVDISNSSNTAPLKMVVKKKVTDNGADTWETVPSGFTVTLTTTTPNVTHSVDNNGVITISYTGVLTKTSSTDGQNYNGTAWIDSILTQRGEGSPCESLAGTNINFVSFDNLVGLYENNYHYYAVEQVTNTSNNGRPSMITFKNTRVGVVSYHVVLDWKLGGWQNEAGNANKEVEVKITPKINGKRITEDGTPIADDDTTSTPLTITRSIPVTNNEFYLTNLPKYNNKGTIIEWELEEIKLDSQNITTDNTCTIDGKTCVVSVSNAVYSYSTEHHTDDLITVTLTNRFEGTTDATVNKIWYDDNNALSLRSDTFMILYRRRKDSNDAFVQYGNKYTFSATNENQWSYTFTDLPMFDDEGHEYEYAIQELEIDDYSTQMYSDFTNHQESALGERLVPSGGTFTDKISGEVIMAGEKVWQNILNTLQHEHYPIAKIQLYRRDKYQKDANGYVLDNAGNKILTTDTADFYTQIGETEIYQGDTKYVFKPNFTTENNNITAMNPEIDAGNYVEDKTKEKVNDQYVPLTANTKYNIKSIVLPKFDDDGALIKYKLDETGITGYTFKVSDDAIVNDYNGGRPVEITVTKSWENMNENYQYPAVKLILHQIMFAKTTNDKGEILQTNDTYLSNTAENQDPKLTCVEYNTYEMILSKELVEHPTGDLQYTVSKDNNGNWIYTFGKIKPNTTDTRYNSNENLREIAPDGTFFAYYVTEQLINFEDQAVELNAIEDTSTNPATLNFLGDFYKADKVPQTNVTVRDSVYGFTIKTYTQPASIENVDQQTDVIQRSAEIKNSYEPEIENYEGNLIVTKEWDDKDTEGTENGLNTEFNGVQGYSVKVSRLTSNIAEKSIFDIKTGNEDTDEPVVTTALGSEYESEFTITSSGAMTLHYTDDDSTKPISYYEQTFKFKKSSYTFEQAIDVTFRIHKRRPGDTDYAQMHNKIEIHGLAIYAQDATKYTYVITEDTAEPGDPMRAFKAKYSNGSNTWLDTPVGKKMEGDNHSASFGLKNELKVFTLNLYKVFGKTYKVDGANQTHILEQRDYNLYFNEDFVNELRFELWRKKNKDGEDYERYDYTDTSISSHVKTDGEGENTHYKYSVNVSGQTYSLQFKNLPKYSPDGYEYYYQVREKDAPEGAKYTILYTNSIGDVGTSAYTSVTCGDGTNTMNTYVRNVFEAKQITINKFWDDNNNVDGLRPTNVKVTVTEHIPAYTTSESTTLPAATVDSIRILKDSGGWHQDVQFPQYYYNGKVPVPGLAYSISETTKLTTGSDGAYIYDLPANGYIDPVYSYRLVGDSNTIRLFDTNTTSVKIAGDGTSTNDLSELNVTNSKKPINSKLTFDKVWDDSNNKWSLRPDVIYVKLKRNVKDIINITSTKNILIPSSKKDASDKITAEIRYLDKDAVYKIIRRNSDGETWVELTPTESTDDYTTFSNDTTGTTTETKTLTFTLDNVGSVTEVVKIQKKNSSDEWEDIDTENGQKLRVILTSSAPSSDEIVTTNNVGQPAGVKDTNTTFSTSGTASFTIPANTAIDGKVSVLVEGLPKDNGSGNNYYYRVSGSDTNLVTRDLPNGTVSVIATISVGSTNTTLQLTKSTDGTTFINVEAADLTSATAYRYFAADSTTGVVAIPVASSGIVNNPGVVFEELNYGKNTGGTVQHNGEWQPYYYTIVECDKAGYASDSRLTSTQTANTTARPINESVNMTFKINVSNYVGETPSDPRKHINIRVMCNGNIVKKDINGKPLKVTVDGDDAAFYASNVSDTIPVEGVIVIPVTPKENEDYIECTVYDLPYAACNGSGGYSDSPYQYTVTRCNASGVGKSITLYNYTTTGSGDPVYYQWKYNETPPTTKVTFSKTWSVEDKKEGLIPAHLHLALYRSIPGVENSEERVTVDGHDFSSIAIPTTLPTKVQNGSTVYHYTDESIPELPAGKVVNYTDSGITDGSGGTGIWRKYTYYFKEYYDAGTQNAQNEKNASSSYEPFEQTKGVDKPFVLNAEKTEAAISEGAKNKLSLTTHDVTKEWKDDPEHQNREDYYVVLQRRAGVSGAWENVYLGSDPTIEYVNKDGENVTRVPFDGTITTEGSGENAYSVLRVDKAKLHLSISDLPYCDTNGAPYQYRAAEVKIGNSSVSSGNEPEKTYLFLVPGTEPTDEDYSYVRVVRRGTQNYYVNYNYDSAVTNYEDADYDYSSSKDTTSIFNEVVKDSVTFTRISVTKKWDDEDNLYGKRPEKIYYHLSRTEKGQLDTSFKSPDKEANESNEWTCYWDQLAAFAANGNRFEYYVTELPVANYTTSSDESVQKNSVGEIEKTIVFTNTYNPPKKKITAQKQWDDANDKYGLRPGASEVKYELYCKYDVYNSTDVVENNKVTGRTYSDNPTSTYNSKVYDSSKTYAQQSEVFKEIVRELNPTKTTDRLNALTPQDLNDYSYMFENTFNNGTTTSDTWTLNFGEYEDPSTHAKHSVLPAWINTTADGRFAGKSVKVTYYVVETFGNKDNAVKKIYSCEASNSTDGTNLTVGSSKDSWVLEQGKLYSYTVECNNGVYTIPASIAVSKTARVMIKDLPHCDSAGKDYTKSGTETNNEYTYTVVETDANGNVITPSSHNVKIENKKFVEAEVTNENEIVKQKDEQDTVDLIITAENVTNDPVYFKVICQKTIIENVFITNFTNYSLQNDTNGTGTVIGTPSVDGIIRFKASDSIPENTTGTATITISGLEKSDGNGHNYKYEAVEYDNNESNATALLLSADKSIIVSSEDTGNNTVTLTITKNGARSITQNNATVGQDIYFKLRRTKVYSEADDAVLTGKSAHPFFICSAEPDDQYEYVNDLISANFDTNVSQYNILTENDIFCYTANNSSDTEQSESFTIKNLPEKDPYGFNYTYTIEKYEGYYPGAKALSTNATITPDSASQGNGTVTLTVTNNYYANEKMYFKVKREVDYSQTNNLGTLTEMKSEEDNNTSASIRNTLDTRNITVALDWQDNGYMNGVAITDQDSEYTAHPNEDKVNTLHYNTKVTLSYNVNSTDYNEAKTITVTNKNKNNDNKRTYVTKYGVVFKDLPKYGADGQVINYNLNQKIDYSDPTEADYSEQHVLAYDDTTGKTEISASATKTVESGYYGESDGNLNGKPKGKKYDYTSTYTSYTDNIEGSDYVTQYNILNSLPLTEVDVVKHWDDESNKFGFRPNAPTEQNNIDPLGLVLETRVTGETTWGNPDYVLSQTPAERIKDNGDNTWTYTYKKLLKSDDKNHLYQFKITEKPGDSVTNVNGYLMPNYNTSYLTNSSKDAKQTIVNADSNNPLENNDDEDWDGEHPLTTTMDITNKLDTRDIIVTKTWNDNGYGGDAGNATAKALHYDLAVTLTGTKPGLNGAAGTSLTWTDGSDTVSSATKVLGKDAVGTIGNSNDDTQNHKLNLIFKEFPKYDTNGNVIIYSISEEKASASASSGEDNLTTVVKTAGTGHLTSVNTTAIASFEQANYSGEENKTKNDYGYEGSCTYIVNYDGTDSTKTYVEQFNITNTLPLTKVSVTKHWDDLHNTYNLRPDDVTFDLYRTTATGGSLSENGTESTGWNKITSDENAGKLYTKSTVTKTTNSGNILDTWTFNYDLLLRYAEDNKLYSYKEKEVYSSATMGAYEILQTQNGSTYVQTNVDRVATGTATGDYALEFTNRLLRRNITITQAWDEYWGQTDHSSAYHDLRYKVAVNLKCDNNTVTQSEWNTDIDVPDQDPDNSGVYLHENSVTINDVPLYDKDHKPLAYTVTQNKASDVTTGADLSTNRTDCDGKFIQESACSNYVATCSALTDNNGVLKSFTMTNTLPLIHYTAAKTWYDDNNRDGLRPTGSNPTGTFGFTLSQYTGDPTSNTTLNPSLTSSDTVNETNWSKSFGYYPEYQPDNTQYYYTVKEYGSTNFKYKDKYTESSSQAQNTSVNETTNSVQTEKQLDYSFTNTHNPFTGSLTANKLWVGDTPNYYTQTRPDSIQFKLQCSKNDGTTWEDAESAVYVSGFINPQHPNYQYTRTLSNEDNRSETFEHLPLYVNTPGNTTTGYSYNNSVASLISNGTSSTIKYRVVEVKDEVLNGYDSNAYENSYSAETFDWSDFNKSGTATPTTKTETITNTLKTKDVTVVKEWVDNGYSALYSGDHAHYDVSVKITPVEITTYTGGTEQQITADATGTTGTITFTGLPIYTNTGAEAQYKLEEIWDVDNANRHYNYDRAYYTTTGEELTGNGKDTFKPAQEKYQALKVKNTLELTTVTVTKKWEDTTDKYSLRPDKVTLQLYRTTKSGANHETSEVSQGKGNAANVWEPVGAPFDIDKPNGSTTDTWTKTISGLLKYDFSNTEYVFKVEETEVKGYTTEYTTGKALTTSSSKELEVKNTLITRSVKITKQWVDGGYSDAASLHYNVYMKLHADVKDTAIPSAITFEGLIDKDNNDAALRDNVTFTNVPAYDKAGDPIVYTVSESPDDTSHYGGAHYGYVRSDGTSHQWGTHTDVYDEYTVINTLPLTTVKVTKNWEYLDVYPAHTPTTVAVDITRTGVNPTDTAKSTDVIIHPSSTTSIAAPAASTYSANSEYTNELVYDYNNDPFTYSVAEQSLISGFELDQASSVLTGSTVTTQNETTTIVNPVELSLTNKEITHNVSLTKIDKTYEDLYKTYPNYHDLTLPDAKFNLYKTQESQDDVICYVTGTSVTYTFDGTAAKYDETTNPHTQTNTTDIISGANGEINITGLPLGTYKLVEIDAPTGYELDSMPYNFTLSVNDNNQSTDTFSGDKKIRNEEKKATATLTKQDASTDLPITSSQATYYMLRLIPRIVTTAETSADEDEANAAYLNSAKEAIENFNFNNAAASMTAIKAYWDIANTVQTGSNGSVTVSLIEHGTYAFLECQAPIGYEIDNHEERFSVNGTANTAVFEVNYLNHESSFVIVHEDPRKTATVDIYKQDKYENPLNGAEFELYYKQDDSTSELIAKVTTGDDGLTKSVTVETPYQNSTTESDYVIVSDGKVVLKKWGDYYWKEVTPPGGYNKDADEEMNFTIDAEKADMTVYITKASDTRIPGKATLKKVAKEATATTPVGAPLEGATFELHKENSNSAIDVIKRTSDGTYVVKPASLDGLTGYETDSNSSIIVYTQMVTNNNGLINVEGLDWGSYEFVEIGAPSGFVKTNSNENNADNKVKFTVGRNNCETGVDLICRDEAQKAKLKVTKNIDYLNADAWGEPTFIFRIKQTGKFDSTGNAIEDLTEAQQRVKTVKLTFEKNTSNTNGTYTASTAYYDIEPGRYEVTEVNVSRYKFKHVSISDDNKVNVSGDSCDDTNKKATLTIGANGSAEVIFDNEIEYYDKFSQVDVEENKFNGYKGIRVEYNNAVPVTGNESTINKTALDVYKIMGNGTEVKLDPNNTEDAAIMNSITYTYVEKTKDDPRFGKNTPHDLSDDTNNNQLKIANPSRYIDGVYTLRANYQGLTCDFDIHFASADGTTKEYQKTVVFKADDDNRSYFNEAGGTSQYAFVFTMVKKTNSEDYYVHTIKHNGVVIATGSENDDATTSVIAKTMNDALSTLKNTTLTVNEAYIGTKEFDCWNKDNSNQTSGQPDYAALVNLVKTSGEGTITYTAVLKSTSTPTP